MDSVKGYQIELFLNGQPSALTTGKFGLVGRLNPGDVVEVVFIKDDKHPNHRILVKADHMRNNAIELRRCSDGTYRHQMSVIPEDRGGSTIADQTTNCVYLAEMDSTGFVNVTNVTLISQKGDFFLVFQQTYCVQAYAQTKPTSVAIPGLYGDGGFAELAVFIADYYRKDPTIRLPDVSEYSDKPLPDASWVPDNNYAVVRFWSIRRGTGVAVRKDGVQVKLYQGNVRVAKQTPIYFSEGDVVKVDGWRKPHGRSGLEWEGMGIERTELEAPVSA
jgi:hypothetical protein